MKSKYTGIPQSENLNKRTRSLQEGAMNTMEYLKAKREGRLTAADTAHKNVLQEGTSYSVSGRVKREKEKALLESRKLEYENSTAKNAFVDIMTDLVIESLLIDIDEYAKMNPNYRNDIRESVDMLVELNGVPTGNKPEVILILENIARNIPTKEVGIYMESTDIHKAIIDNAGENIEDSIKKISVDAKDKVAEIVKDEQKNATEIEKDIEAIASDDKGIPASKDRPAEGIVETIATNEILKAVREGRDYNSDLALANAITFVTIIESLRAAEVLDISKSEYKQLANSFVL